MSALTMRVRSKNPRAPKGVCQAPGCVRSASVVAVILDYDAEQLCRKCWAEWVKNWNAAGGRA